MESRRVFFVAHLLNEKTPREKTKKNTTNTFCVPVHTLDIPVPGEQVYLDPHKKKTNQNTGHLSFGMAECLSGGMECHPEIEIGCESSRCQSMKLQLSIWDTINNF